MSKTRIGEELMTDEYYDLERRTEIKAEAGRLKKKFLTWRECEIVYSLQHRKLLKLADECGAIYRFDGSMELFSSTGISLMPIWRSSGRSLLPRDRSVR